MSALNIVALLLAIPPVLLLAVFVAEVVAGLRPLATPARASEVPRFTVLIPAHNEAAGIGATIRSLRDENPAIDLLVVADNCNDDTAYRAREAGARVVERNDPARRGKGYALAFGRDVLAAAPPACVIVLDADCAMLGEGPPALARSAIGIGRAVQARNLQRPDLAASPTAQISSFAFLVKNLIRQRGTVRWGGVAALTGTGMAIPWAPFAAAPLASADLAEDLALGVWLTRAGEPPLADETVHVWSDAASGKALLVQRNRWERGFLSVARHRALPLIAGGILATSRSRAWFGLHLLVPPLALLFAGGIASLAATGLLAAFGATLAAPATVAVALAVAGLATVTAWLVEGRGRVNGRALLAIPFYIVAKLPLYRGLLRGNSGQAWVRTARATEIDTSSDGPR